MARLQPARCPAAAFYLPLLPCSFSPFNTKSWVQFCNFSYLSPMGWLSQKRIVIIGGTTGIGLSAAHAFVREGAHIVAVGHTAESATSARSALGAAALVMVGDATQEATAQDAIACCEEQWGGVDGLYHVAGGSGRAFGDGPLHTLSLEGWNKTLELNLTSLMLSNRAAVNAFRRNKSAGSILNMTSVLSYSPSPPFFATHAYAAAKAAVHGFSRSLAAYYAHDNIRVNALAPALVDTPMAQRAANEPRIQAFIQTKQPLEGGRMGKPGDMDGIAVYFLSDYSRFTTGQLFSVDGGWDVSEGQVPPP